MPVHKCPNGKYRIGSGPCIYKTKKAADRAYAAYRAIRHTYQSLQNMSTWQRRLFNYRIELAQEWLGYYEEGIRIGAPDCDLYAWDRFRDKYAKDEFGRWILRR